MSSGSKKIAAAIQRDSFSAYVNDEDTLELMRAVAHELGWNPDKIYRGGLRTAIQTLAVSPSPQILVTDLSDSGDPLNDISALAEVCEPGTIVITLGVVNDVFLYRDLVASGIHDYLLKPLAADLLRCALQGAQASLNAPKTSVAAEKAPTTMIAVIGARGGVGASSLAGSLAWLLSDRQKKRTALLDLDIHFGVGALAFDLEPGRGLTEALENPSRVDSLFIERAIVKASETLSILSAEAPINTPLLTDGAALHHLEDEMRQSFEAVVVDLPRLLAVQNPHLLSDVTDVVVVTDQTLAATRDMIRLLSFLKSSAPTATVHVVANKVSAALPPEVNHRDFEASIEHALDVILPLDPKLATLAARQGKSLVDVGQGTKLAQGVEALLARITGQAFRPKTSLLAGLKLEGLFKSAGKTSKAKKKAAG